jgi:hypothetical protein
MKIAVWREQDQMRQRAIRSKVIPRGIRDGKENAIASLQP